MSPSATPHELRPTLVGRDDELVFLRRRLGEAVLGRGSLTVIEAEAGLGKTRLVEEIGTVARTRSLPVLPARGGGSGVACDLFTGVLTGLVSGGHRQAVAALVAETQPELWPRVFAEARPATTPVPAQLRQPLFLSRLASLLIDHAGKQAILVCLEDLHDADSASLPALSHLVAEVTDAAVMIVATCRPPAVDDDLGLHRWLQELHRLEHVHRLELGPLSAAASRRLVSSCFVREGFSDELFQLVHRRCAGVPLDILQLLEVLLQRRVLRQERGLWIEHSFDHDDLPDSVRGAIRKRLDALTGAERELLGMAAVQGTEFQGQLLAQTLAQSPSRTLKSLADLARRTRLVQPTERGFRFAHAVVTETLYQGLSPLQRRHLHLRTASLLERLTPERTEELAHHLYRAGVFDRALPALLKAARRAADAFAYREARVLLNRADAASNGLGAAAPAAERLECLLLQAEVEDRLGDRQRSLEVARLALGRASAGTSIMARVLLQMAQVRRRQGDWAEAEDLYRQALDQFVRAGDETLAAKTQIGMANLAFERSALDEARSRLADARDVAQRLQDHALLGAIYGNLGALASVCGDSMQAVLHFTEAVKSYSRVNHQYGICQTLHNLGMCYSGQGEWLEAMKTYARGEQLAERLGTVDVLANLRVSKALAQVRLGDLDAAEGSCLQAQGLMERSGDRLGVAECRKVEGMILAARGQHEEARRRLELGRQACAELDNQLGVAECDHELALLAHDTGDVDAARRRLAGSARRFEEVGAAGEARRARELLAEMSR